MNKAHATNTLLKESRHRGSREFSQSQRLLDLDIPPAKTLTLE